MNEAAEKVNDRFAEFIDGIEAIAADRRKAMHLLFDAIEQDISDKEKFVTSQSKTL